MRLTAKKNPMPKPNQPVRVRLLYTGWGVRERWITFPNFRAYADRCFDRYRPIQDKTGMPRLRRRFTILEVTWDGKAA